MKTSGPLDHYQNTTATTNKWIDVNKWTQGAFLAHGKDFGIVAQRLELNPGAETAYIDEITEEMCNVTPDDYDFGDAQQVARYNADSKRAAAYKELVEQRMKMHAAIKEKVDYIAIGSFYTSKTKKIKFKANIKLLKAAKKMTKIPIVAIGGINLKNYKKLLLNKANFLAISSYVWRNKKLSPVEAIRKLK